MPEPTTDYEWVTDGRITDFAEAGCLTVVFPISDQSALQAIGADPQQSVALTALTDQDALSYISLARPHDGLADDTIVIVEENGWEGSKPDVLRSLSKRSRAASVFWGVDGTVTLTGARRGQILFMIEFPNPDSGELPFLLRRAIRDAPEDMEPVALALVLAERFTGAFIPKIAAIARPTVAYPVISPILSLPATGAELIAGRYPSPAILEAVQAISRPSRRALAEWAALTALEHVGVASSPQLGRALSQFGGGRAVSLDPPILRLRHQADQASRAGNEALAVSDHPNAKRLAHWDGIYWAIEALSYTSVDDETTAALGAIYCASHAHAQQEPEFLAETLRRIQSS